ncbi:hypothetical protein GBO14_11940 [Pseudoalteromonas shioyasakiensis]|uniref:restriction endonuclease subunit S n=1 Tax=Pseudoalteromonas TaxID=53246 RepID=UPI0011096D7A|nr:MULTISPECIES: restriction endonuclease subunit S [Pseudoalteromonas]MCO6355426.1 hypothetical protein [Pseudoalteromonas shioyasakiensis]TMO36863.1 hypothetical protein CWC26_14615 [Pseudoalteromonas sp. S4488]TMO38637.1 hypothetical protein CWC27_02950 [Pseudoalteromonas sp. S4491]
MTGRYKAYPEYKDSEIEWVGDIPASWTVKPTFSVFDPSVSKNTEGQESTVLSLSYGNIVERDVDTNFGLLPESFNTYQIVRDGDLILRLTDLQNDKKSLRVGLVKQTGIITSAYLKLRSNQSIDSRFAYRLLHSYDTTKVFYGMGGGLRQSMKFEDFRRLPILVPPLEEQQKIANFLDHETAKIDTLIAKQEKLIELLKEKRQAVVSHAVTKGLDPDAPMKDSGVEWLGEVPEHWNILKFGITNKSAELGGNYNSGEGEEGLPLIKMGNLGRGDISLKKIEYLPIEESFDKAHLLKCGDFLFNTRNSLDLVGKVSIWKNELPRALYNSNVLRISFEPTLVSSSQYMSYLFNSDLGLSQLRLIAKGTTSVAAIYYKELKSISFPLPTLKEQEEIVEYVEKNIEKLDDLIKQSQKAIQLIKERKTALISAAVTGKIDVRDWEGDC